MALDLATDGIRVHALSLGWAWSVPMQMISGNDRPKTDRVAGRFHVLGRIADAEEVAEALSLLCSQKPNCSPVAPSMPMAVITPWGLKRQIHRLRS